MCLIIFVCKVGDGSLSCRNGRKNWDPSIDKMINMMLGNTWKYVDDALFVIPAYHTLLCGV